MRILYYCPEYYFNHGGRIHARGFFGALEKLPEVSACFIYPKNGQQNAERNGHEKSPSRERLWFLPPTLRRIVRFFRPRQALTRKVIDEIMANQCDALVLRTGVEQPSIKEIRKACPEVVICVEVNSAHFDEAFPGIPLRSLFQAWEVRRLNQADAITVVSTYLKIYLQNHGVAPEKIIVNQNGVDESAVKHTGLSSIRGHYGIPQDAFVIGYIGGMETFRRLPEVIRYITELRKAGNDDIYFLLVGDGVDMPMVQDVIKTNHNILSDAVKLVGWQEHAEIPNYLAAFDIAIFPFTNAYCSPLKLFEYLAAGIPTIGPDTPAVREVFEDGVHLSLVKQDGSDFVDRLLALKSNSELRHKLAERGQLLVKQEYTWEQNAGNVVRLIEEKRQHLA